MKHSTPKNLSGFVLAAGRGTRLAPITDFLPKPAVPLVGLPLAAFALLHMHRAGIQQVVLNAHHLADRLKISVESWKARHLPAMQIHWSVEDELLGTGGGLSRVGALGLVDIKAPLLLINSDVLCDVDTHALVEQHLQSGADATLLVKPRHDASEFGAIRADADGRLIDLAGLWHSESQAEPHLSGIFTGISVLGPAIWRYLPGPDQGSCVVRQGLKPLVEDGGHIHVVEHPGRWQDLGTPARFLHGQATLLQGDWPFPTGAGIDTERVLFDSAAYAIDAQGREYGNRYKLQGTPNIQGPVFIAPFCQFGPNATIGPNSVLGPGVHIGANASVANCSLLARAKIAPGRKVDGIIAGCFKGQSTETSES